MIFYRSVISFLLLIFCSLHSKAQDNFVYTDTSLISADSLETKSTPENVTDDVEEDVYESGGEYFIDTVLLDNKLALEADSVEALKKARPFAYAKNLDSLLQDLKKGQPDGPSWLERFFSSRVTSVVFWILAGLAIVFILSKLFFTEGFFQRQYAKSNVTLVPEESESLLNDADYTKLISQAISSKNYRLAIRYHYLQSLQKLAKKEVIQFAADKTNYQYIQEITGKTYKKEFASLTNHYEYVWYGEVEIDEKILALLQNKFKQFNTQV